MPTHHRKRREPAMHRNRRVPGLWVRPKHPEDKREGDTFEVVFRDEAGKQRQKTLRARHVQRAVEEAEEYRTQVRRGEVVSSPRRKVSEVAAEFFRLTETLVASGERASGTLDLYRQRFEKHIEPVIGRKWIGEVRPDEISAIYGRQRKAGLSPWTMSGTRTVMSALFSFAISRGYVASSPLGRLSKMEQPRQVSQREARRLTDDEVRRLCAAATPRYKPVITTLAWTGLRISEALGLRWGDIDFDEREICVQGQLDRDGKTLKQTKSRAGMRAVPLLPIAAEALREHRRAQLALGLAGNDRLVFTTLTGKPLDRHNVHTQGVLKAADKAGLHTPGGVTVTTHDLRRTFISHLILGLKLDPVQVAKIVGHRSVSLTLNTYAEEFDKVLHRQELHERIEAAGFGAL